MHAMYNKINLLFSSKVVIFNCLFLSSDRNSFIYCLKLVIIVICHQLTKEDTKTFSYQQMPPDKRNLVETTFFHLLSLQHKKT